MAPKRQKETAARSKNEAKKARAASATPPTSSEEEEVEEALTLQSLFGHDDSLFRQARAVSLSEDDPPLWFAWHPEAVSWYHASAGVGRLPPLPPHLFPGGVPAD